MTASKNSNKFTSEDREVLRSLYALRAKREKEMEGMTVDEQYEYIHKIELETQAMAGIKLSSRTK
jgi:hypothetical protein